MPITTQKNKEKIRRRQKANSVIVFLLAFVLFLLVFGGICIWAVVKINEERRSAASSPSSVASATETFGEQDVRRLLLITLDNKQAQGFVAICSDPAKSRIQALAIPRDTVVDVKTTEMRLFELYSQQGITATQKALQDLLGFSFDNYVVIPYENIGKLMDYYESGLIFTLNEDLNYSDEALSIRIGGGTRTLSSSQVVEVLRYPAWHAGRKQRSDIQAQLFAALVNQYMVKSRESRADQDFAKAVNLTTTNIMVSHYNSAKAGLAYLAEGNSGNVCTALSLEGEYQGSGEAIRYYAPDDIRQKLSSVFG